MTTYRYTRLVICCRDRAHAARARRLVPGGYSHYEGGRWWVAVDFTVEEPRFDELAERRRRRLRRPLVG
jgi:hypothetical protein